MKSLSVKAPSNKKLFSLKHQEILPSQANDSKNIFHSWRGKASALNYFLSAKLVKCCSNSVWEKSFLTVNVGSLCTGFFPSLHLYSLIVLYWYYSCLESLLALWMLSFRHKTIYSFFMITNTGWSPLMPHFHPSLVFIFLLQNVIRLLVRKK